jgi:hypothetical protein
MKTPRVVAMLIALNLQRYVRERQERSGTTAIHTVRQYRMHFNQLRVLYNTKTRLPTNWFSELQFEMSELGYVMTYSGDAELLFTEQAYVESVVKLSAKRVNSEVSRSSEEIERMFKMEWRPEVWMPPVRNLNINPNHVEEQEA